MTGMTAKLKNISKIVLYTGSNTRCDCTCNCLGCFLGDSKTRKASYQGELEQIHEMLNVLPNLKSVRMYGNPDISVDAHFCNAVAKCLQNKGIELEFFTSGIGGAKVIETVLDEISPSSVKRVIFSVDTLSIEKLTQMKGTKISLETILEGIECCNRLNIPFSVLAVIWPMNVDDDWIAYHNFFKSFGARNVIARFGSVEGTTGNVSHVPEDKVLEIIEKYKSSPIILNKLFINNDEHEGRMFGAEFYDRSKIKCTDWSLSSADSLYVYLEDGTIKATSICPYFADLSPNHYVSIHSIETLEAPFTGDVNECPIAGRLLGYKPVKSRSICRYYLTSG